MRQLAIAAFVLCCTVSASLVAQERREVGALVLDGIPEIPKEIEQRMNQYQSVRGALFADWDAAGEGMVVLTRFAETSQAHAVGAPGAYRQQLTFFPEPVRGLAADPKDPTGLLLVMDIGGGEFYQLFRLDRETGRTRLLTDGKSRNESPVFARRGGRIAYVSTRRNSKDFDLYVQETAAGATAKLVKELAGQWVPLDWSPDDRRVLLQQYISINESYLHVVDVETGAMQQVNAKPGEKISYAAAAFAGPDVLLYTSDEGAEFLRLTRYDLKTNAKEVLTPALAWDVTDVKVSDDLKHVAYVANEGGTSGLYVAPLAGVKKATRVALPKGVIGALDFDRKGARLGFSFNSATAPDDAYTLDLKTKKLVRWTFSEVGGLNPKTFVEPTLVEYPSFDGRKIPAWYYKPKTAGKKLPVIINIHGGPESQSLAWFSPLAQYWVNELGVAALYPNVRGSSGYGKSFLLLDNAEKREDSVKDIGALLDWVATQPDLDKDRVAVIGGSYGGFMVLASMARYDDRIRCGIDVVGISHFVTFLEKTEAYRRDLRRAEYGDERDPKMRALLDSISPLTNAKKITKPLFVAQGLNDPRVPAAEAEQIVKTVRSNGGKVWYLLAKDEGHGFSKKRNRDFYTNATSLFFEQFLLK